MSEQLTGPQEAALQAVLDGESYASAALRAKVTRETVSRWANHHPLWMHERRRRTEALEAEYRNQKLKLVPMALGAIEWLLRGPDYLGSNYDARVQLSAAELALRINGMDVGRGFAVQITNLLAQQMTSTSAQTQPDGGRAPFREVHDAT